MKLHDIGVDMFFGAGAVIIAMDTKKILLLERSSYVPNSGTWGLPGGRAELGESPTKTLIRELSEEIGFDVDKQQLRLLNCNVQYAPHFKFHNYLIVVPKEFEPILNYEHTNWVWADLNDLPSPLHWGVKALTVNKKVRRRLKKIIAV